MIKEYIKEYAVHNLVSAFENDSFTEASLIFLYLLKTLSKKEKNEISMFLFEVINNIFLEEELSETFIRYNRLKEMFELTQD